MHVFATRSDTHTVSAARAARGGAHRRHDVTLRLACAVSAVLSLSLPSVAAAQVYVDREVQIQCSQGEVHRIRLDTPKSCSTAVRWNVTLAGNCEATLAESEFLRLELDVGDGNGFRDVSAGGSFTATYEGGPASMRARLDYDGIPPLRDFERPAASRIVARSLSFSAQQIMAPDEVWDLSGQFQGSTFPGDAHLFLSDPPRGLQRPVVVLDGIDFDSSNRWDCLYQIVNKTVDLSTAERSALRLPPEGEIRVVEALVAGGFDVVLLDFRRGADDVRGNAMVLVELLRRIAEAGNPPVTVLGPSMGGVVARYALLAMEQQGIDHRVDLFVSFDSPHFGANVPLGLQYLADWVGDLLPEVAPEVPPAAEYLGLPAVRQLLTRHVYTDRLARRLGQDTDETLYTDPGPAPEHVELLEELEAMGGFPDGVRCSVAFANGSVTGRGQRAFDGSTLWPGSELASARLEAGLGPLPGADVSASIRAEPQGQRSSKVLDADGEVWARVSIDGFPLDKLNSKVTYHARSGLGADTAPGGSFPFGEDDVSFDDLPLGEVGLLDVFELDVRGSFNYIPTRSALGLPPRPGSGGLYGDLSSTILGETPFDRIYPAVGDNEVHVDFSSEKGSALVMELLRAATTGACPRQTCVPNTTSTCRVANGDGRRTCNADGSAYGSCGSAFRCDSGYRLEGGRCVRNTGVWTAESFDYMDGLRCPNFGLPGCGTGGSSCGPIGSWCLARILRNSSSACHYSTRRCERKVCEANTTQSCSIPNGRGTRSCNAYGSALSACTLVSCNSGYYAQGGSCREQVCTPRSTQSCSVSNGRGTRTCNGNGSALGACTLVSCNSGYYAQGGSCRRQACTPRSARSCSSPGAVEAIQSCNSSGSAWGSCRVISCRPGYVRRSGRCVQSSPGGPRPPVHIF